MKIKKIIAATLAVATAATMAVTVSAYDTNSSTCTNLAYKGTANNGGYSYSSSSAIASYAELNYNDVMKATAAFTLPSGYGNGKVIAFFDKGTTGAQAKAMADKIYKNGLKNTNGQKVNLQICLEVIEDNQYNPRFLIRVFDNNASDLKYLLSSAKYEEIKLDHINDPDEDLTRITFVNKYFPGLKFNASNFSSSGCVLNLYTPEDDYAYFEAVYSFKELYVLNTPFYLYGANCNNNSVKDNDTIPATLGSYKYTYGKYEKYGNSKTAKFDTFIVDEGGKYGKAYDALSGDAAKNAYNKNDFIGTTVKGSTVYIYIGQAKTITSGLRGESKWSNVYRDKNYTILCGEVIQKVIDKYGFANIRYYDNCLTSNEGTYLCSRAVSRVSEW